jgi:hypothetical protein
MRYENYFKISKLKGCNVVFEKYTFPNNMIFNIESKVGAKFQGNSDVFITNINDVKKNENNSFRNKLFSLKLLFFRFFGT